MKNVTLTQIKKSVLAAGGTYEKLPITLNGNHAYRVNGKVYTEQHLIFVFIFDGLL